jgi:hypothetical protein
VLRSAACGNPLGSHSKTIPPLTTAQIGTEHLQDTLLIMEQLTTGLTVLALNASNAPKESPRDRVQLASMHALLQQCKTELGTYAAPLA